MEVTTSSHNMKHGKSNRQSRRVASGCRKPTTKSAYAMQCCVGLRPAKLLRHAMQGSCHLQTQQPGKGDCTEALRLCQTLAACNRVSTFASVYMNQYRLTV
jgi:hypothetical protein